MQLSRSEFVKFLLSTLANRGTTSTEELVSAVDSFMPMVPHLAEHRQAIVDDLLTAVVTTVGKAEVLVDDDEIVRWLASASRTGWAHWPWLQRYLSEVVGRPLAVLSELDDSSDEVIDMLGDPSREGVWDRRGLVVGHVQSGKTEHYTAVAAKALDAGYKVVIILSGIHENLRQQTQERVEEVLVGKDSRDSFAHTGIRDWSSSRLKVRVPDDPVVSLPDISTLTSVAGDYGAAVNKITSVAAGHAPIIMVVKKNVSILKNLLAWVSTTTNSGALQAPTLIIDDEADHSSINTNAADPETDPTAINRLIRRILWRCDRVAFVGYTATPYANIFMDPTPAEKTADRDLDALGPDIFPKTFIISLKAPTNYVGPEEVFGREADDSLGIPAVAPLPMHRSADDADSWLPARHRKTHLVSPDLPASLREALRAFLLTVAARMALGQGDEHMSMLIHVSRFTDVQEQVTKHVEVELSTFVEALRHSAHSADEWSTLASLWEEIFASAYGAFKNHPSQQLVKPVLPPWSAVRKHVLSAYGRIVFRSINSATKENLDYRQSKDGLIVVAVGGDRLSRGLTLSGLSISYFLRGAKAFDTLMQMGRWFGYRPAYAHLCRIYAPDGVVEAFKTVALATEELRREFSRMSFLRRRPTEYGLRVREPRVDLLVTAMNKMRRGETVRVHFAESLASSLTIPHAVGAPNLAALERLVGAMEGRSAATKTKTMMSGEPVSGHHRWDDVSSDDVIAFLRDYRASVNVCFDATSDGSSLIARYVETMVAKGELVEWTVALFENASAPPVFPGRPYRCVNRHLDPEKQKLHPSDYVFRGVALGMDEAIDLPLDNYNAALTLANTAGEKRSKAAFFRNMRAPQRGLLLLYPIAPLPDASATLNTVVVGVAVSFPESKNDMGQDYVCNPRSMAELYGEQLASDALRDDEEDAPLIAVP